MKKLSGADQHAGTTFTRHVSISGQLRSAPKESAVYIGESSRYQGIASSDSALVALRGKPTPVT